MFDTFIALFGGLFLLGRKANKKLMQADMDMRKQEFDSVQNVIQDYDLQWLTLMPQFIKDPWQCLEMIAADLEEVFGEDWRVLFRARRFREEHLGSMTDTYCFRDIWGAAYQIYLSRYGQVCTFIYNVKMIMRGVEADGSENMPKSRECNIRTCRVIERNVQKIHGADMRLWILGFDNNKWTWEHYVKKSRATNCKRPW